MFIKVNDVKLYYEKAGQGHPILLLHGNSEDHTIFDVLAAQLAKDYTVYSIDSRGHGKSDKVPVYHYEEMAQDVAAFIRELGLEKPWVCGFSDGAILGLLAELRNPGLLGKLVLCGCNLNPTAIKPRALAIMKAVHRFTNDELYAMMLREPNIDPEELQALSLPVLVLAGSKDLVLPQHTRLIASSIPGARLLILPGESHTSYVVHSDLLYAAMKTFLDGTRPTFFG